MIAPSSVIGALAPAIGILTNSEGIILRAASITDWVVKSDHDSGGEGQASKIARGLLANSFSDVRQVNNSSFMIEKLSFLNVPVMIGFRLYFIAVYNRCQSWASLGTSE